MGTIQNLLEKIKSQKLSGKTVVILILMAFTGFASFYFFAGKQSVKDTSPRLSSAGKMQLQNKLPPPVTSQQQMALQQEKEEKESGQSNTSDTMTDVYSQLYELSVKEQLLRKQIDVAEMEKRLEDIKKNKDTEKEKDKKGGKTPTIAGFENGVPVLKDGVPGVPIMRTREIKLMGIIGDKAVLMIDGNEHVGRKGDYVAGFQIVDVTSECVNLIDQSTPLINKQTKQVVTTKCLQ